jgi:hypothetical protein
MGRPAEARLPVPELVRAFGYAASLLSLNIYICREMFVRYAAHLNSMQGFWIAMAERTGGAWFHSDWWRFRDCGATLEFVYAPLVPAMSAWTASVRGVPQDVAF